MAVVSNPLGPVIVTGEEAKAFSRAVRFGRGTRAAADAAANGRRMVAEFRQVGTVTVQLRPQKGYGKRP